MGASSVVARNVRPWPKLCSSSYPWFLSTLKLSFSIFQRARPQATISATLSWNRGHPGHGIFDLALGVENLEADPVVQHGVPAVAQGNRLDPAVTEGLFRIAAADFFLMATERGPVDEVVQRLVGSRLAGEDEIIAGVGHHLGDGMAGEQIVAQERGAQRRRALCFSNQRLTALRSQSCFSARSSGAMNSGVSGTTLESPAPRPSLTAWNDSYDLTVGALKSGSAGIRVSASRTVRPQGDQGPSAQPAERLPHRRLGRQRFQRSKKGCSSALVQRAALAFLQRVLMAETTRSA